MTKAIKPYNFPNNCHKKTSNKILTKIVIHYLNPNTTNCKVLLLDGINLETTKMLNSDANIPLENITSVELDDETCQAHEQMINCVNMPLKDFINCSKYFEHHETYDVAYLDANGGVNKVGKQVVNFVKNGLLKKGGIIGFTFSKRNGSGKRFLPTYNRWRWRFVKELMKKGMEIHHYEIHEYGGGRGSKQSAMYTEFVVTK